MARRTPETNQEWLEYYEKKYRKAFDNFQSTGESRYDREQYRYEVICDALRAKIDSLDERDHDRRKRLQNIDAYIDRYLHDHLKTYTHDEVVKMLKEVGGL